ncbi:dihydrodipicolinate synthase family protein, partial [Enterobacter sp. 63]
CLVGSEMCIRDSYGCELNGLTSGQVRAPLQSLDEEEKAQLKAVIADVKRNVAAVTAA